MKTSSSNGKSTGNCGRNNGKESRRASGHKEVSKKSVAKRPIPPRKPGKNEK